MATIRFKALEVVFSRQPLKIDTPKEKISEYFGVNVFDKEKMQKYLSNEAYTSVINAIEKGYRIERKIANQVASGMKAWAIERGTTHYTHWFHPLNGSTAEKHDAFFEYDENGKVFENFDGKLLIQQEPDASSFPSGGIRNTFEARGYTAWDPSSPAFIVGKTLCIPTIFVSYTGEALDYKMPLLKSIQALDKAAVNVCKYFDKNVEKVIATLGCEQEYFLIDEALYNARPDLSLTDRTLMGHSSAKDQQLDDHYFGSIPERVSSYMRDFEIEAYKLGIPVKTRHNEVAPNQFECAPIYEEVNLAVDHNQLLMDIMKRVARKHKFRVLFHEKPFKGINGSGKHNNWSLKTDTGVNLLSPGKTPKVNLQFITFLVNIIKAVYEYSDLLKASISLPGNEYRLGGNEAPPSIMSIFLGSKLSNILEEIETKVTDKKMSPDEKAELKLNIGKIPEILLDNTDRNRTSPFAFTGNRFEYRAVGASANCASPMFTLNTVVANQLIKFKKDVNTIIQKGVKKDEAIFQVLRKYIIESKKIRFEGNGYSSEWLEESTGRGLSDIFEVPMALKSLISDKSKKLFTDNEILTPRELEARYDIKLEIYIKKIQIEGRILGDLAINHIIPTAIKYQNILIENIKGIKEILPENDSKEISEIQLQSIKKISYHISSIRKEVINMVEIRKKANMIENIREKATVYSSDVKPYLEKIRFHIDKLELIVDDEIWPLPKYRELLFAR
ncbi:MAG: glutamine synthetase III [Bacteroidales bacterium]|nr:glutamine synthetase III [Bacteroidales bacterium]